MDFVKGDLSNDDGGLDRSFGRVLVLNGEIIFSRVELNLGLAANGQAGEVGTDGLFGLDGPLGGLEFAVLIDTFAHALPVVT